MGDFKSYFTDSSVDWTPQSHYGARVGVPWQMDGNGPNSGLNDTVTLAGVPGNWGGCGDCTVAGMAHSLTLANFEVPNSPSLPSIPSANTCVTTYCQLAGCTPAELFSNPTKYDTGVGIGAMLATWRTSGLFGVAAGGVFAPVNPANMGDVRNGLHLSGGLLIGIQFQNAQIYGGQQMGSWHWVPAKMDDGRTNPAAAIVGGHTILLTGYTTSQGLFWGVTWGTLIPIAESFLVNAMDEAYALVWPQMIKYGKGPTGLDVRRLEADIKKLVPTWWEPT